MNTARMTSKNEAARILGSITSVRKAIASRENGKRGGYWQQERNRLTPIVGLNKRYEIHGDKSKNST